MVFLYSTLHKEYSVRFGAHIAPASMDYNGADRVENFPNGDAACTWSVEQSLIVKKGSVLRGSLDSKQTAIGAISDLWTFALWNREMYVWLISQTEGLYDVPCTLLTYDKSALSGFSTLVYLWGNVHVPHPNELVSFQNRYFERPTFKFYDCVYAT